MPAANKNKIQSPAPIHSFPVVGIGASAGGLDAFKRLLKTIPVDSGMAYVLVQHLAPSHESALPEILQRVTKIPVTEITDEVILTPDHIYVIPSNRILTTSDGVLKLSPRDSIKTNLIIDVFFTSLAVVREGFAVGIVLSGSGTDGTLGLKMIKEHGGITIAQKESSAAFSDMPLHAINAGVVDFVLPPEEISAKLLQINSTSHFSPRTDEKAEPSTPDEETVFRQILLLLHQRSGADFAYYKQPTVRRRIARRMAMHKKDKLSDYLKFLRADKSEQDALFQDLLISVTSFFRDLKTFDTLCKTIFPTLFKSDASDHPIRIWVAGCSTGEEAYSIAICLHEFLGKKSAGRQIQIFASDISEIAIKKARVGIYNKVEVQALSDAQLEKYFTKTDGHYQVNRIIRDVCVFAVHNFLKDPPFAKVDLISCRNVLIYMDTFLQKKALSTFQYALNENGILVLGKSETTGAAPELFLQLQRGEKIYSPKVVAARYMHVATERKERIFATENRDVAKPETTQTDFRKSAEAVLIAKSPPSVVVNEQMDIVHIHGDTSEFLKPPAGKPTFNLFRMARESLAFELRNAVHKVQQRKDRVIRENIAMGSNGSQMLVTIEIIPLSNTVDTHYLILFDKTESVIIPPKRNKKGESKKDSQQERSLAYERELLQTREDMRSITEEHDAANEELQSANEELQSSNEEMQSLNEELETSKEELQSANEELLIVNQELLDKQEQLNTSRLYSESIIATLREPLIVLDKHFRVKTANASFYKSFKLTEAEAEGKLFFEIQNHRWDDAELRSLLEDVLPEKRSVENFEISLTLFDTPRHFMLNALQVINGKNNEPLILITVEDVTQSVLYRKLEESEGRFRKLAEALPHMIWTATPDGKKDFFNQFFLDYTGLSFEELKGDGWQRIIFSDDLARELEQWAHIINTGKDFKIEKRVRSHDGTYKWHLSHGIAQIDPAGKITGWIGTNTEIEDQKNFTEELESKIRETTRELSEKENYLNQIITNAPDAVIVINEKSQITLWNPKTEEIFGWKSEEVYGENIEDTIIHPRHRDAGGGGIKRFMQTDDAEILNHTRELTALHKDGKEFPISITISQATQGGVTFFIVFLRDITEEKQNKEDLVFKTKQLEEAIRELATQNDELASFTYIASHDLQEPLRKIQTFTGRILQRTDDNLSETSKDYFSRSMKAAQRMQSLIDALLQYSRTNTGERIFVETDLNVLLEEVKGELREMLEEADGVIEAEELPTIPIIGCQFAQLFTNIISNAVKYRKESEKLSIKIISTKVSSEEIETDKVLGKKLYWKISISDNGIGFEPQYSTKIFELFQRLHGKSEYSGTGIGLAICKKITENHNGIITAQGEVGVGSTFNIYLPISTQ